MNKLPVSLVVITLNEESNIQRCLQSVPWAAEVLVVDSFSTDQTVALASQLGAKVLQKKWQGYGEQKKWAAESASQDWILSLDADEALTPELAAEIYSLWPSVDAQAGYLLPRLSYHLGRWIRHGGWHPDYQLRLFNKKHSQWDGLQVHEKVKVKNQVKLKASILHWVFDNISDQVITNDKYSGLLAQNLSQQQRSFSIFKLITKPISKFIETYFWKRGFLDGLPGLIIAVSAAYSVFLKWAKLWEIQCLQKKI